MIRRRRFFALFLLVTMVTGSLVLFVRGNKVFAQSANIYEMTLYPTYQFHVLNYPTGLALLNGALLIADSGNHVIRSFYQGQLTVWAGAVGQSGYVDGPPSTARFNHPTDLSVFVSPYSADYIYITDQNNYVVRQHTIAFGYNQVQTFAGSGGNQGFVDGTGTAARFSNMAGISLVGNTNNNVVCDTRNHAIRQVNSGGQVVTYAGTGAVGMTNGFRTTATFNCPTKVTWDSSGNMYVADSNNHAIRKIDTAGNVTTFAGTGQPGYADGPGTSAKFDMPCAILFNPADNSLYVVDSFNSMIRKITLQGVVSTYAGGYPGGLVNGSLAQSRFDCPMDIVISLGTMYVSDAFNNSIRAIDMVHGTVSTYLN